MTFPRFLIRDMVTSQRRLLTEHLGIAHVAAVVAPSMGGMQVLQWRRGIPTSWTASWRWRGAWWSWTHDVGTTPGMNGDYVKARRGIKAKTLIVTGQKDLLNPEWEPAAPSEKHGFPLHRDCPLLGLYCSGSLLTRHVSQSRLSPSG